MRVCENDSGYTRRVHRKWTPILQAQVFESLKQTAIDQQAVIAVRDEIFGSCDGPGTAKK